MNSIDMSTYTSPAPMWQGGPQATTLRETHTPSYTRYPEAKPGRGRPKNPCPHGSVQKPTKWMNPLCHEPDDDTSTCCLGFWCPQMLYGRTQYRLHQMVRDKDPRDLKDYKVFNAPCALFWIVGAFTGCECQGTLISFQHSRIRATYNIEGSTVDDCCSAYCCPCCTLMQDDREIRARENRQAEARGNNLDSINDQPRTRPDMQFTASHRGSLEIQNTKTTSVQNQDFKTQGINNEKQHGSSRSNHDHGHKSLEKVPKVQTNNEKSDFKGPKVNHLETSNGPAVGNTYNGKSAPLEPAINPVTKYAKPTMEGIDGVNDSRPAESDQSQSVKDKGYPKNSPPSYPGDGASGSENQGPLINRRPVLDYSEEACISQVRGKRVLRQLTESQSNTVWPAATNTSENPADESVLVFYYDADQPQRHRLADCARLRASTLGRPGTPVAWRSDETVGINNQPEMAQLKCPSGALEADTAEISKYTTLQNSQRDCAGDVLTSAKKNISQLNLAKRTHTAANLKLIGSEALEQHAMVDCAVITESESSEVSSLMQHEITDPATISSSQSPQISDIDSYRLAAQSHGQLRSNPGIQQNESHTMTTTTPQSPAINTGSNSSAQQNDLRPSQNSEIVHGSGDTMPMSAQQASQEMVISKAGPSGRQRDLHDGASDADGEYENPLKHAAAAMRSFLDAAATERRDAAAKARAKAV